VGRSTGMEEYVIRFIFSEVEKRCGDELALLGATYARLSEKIPVLKLREAQEIIFQRTAATLEPKKI